LKSFAFDPWARDAHGYSIAALQAAYDTDDGHALPLGWAIATLTRMSFVLAGTRDVAAAFKKTARPGKV
jgi:hypothetical protein